MTKKFDFNKGLTELEDIVKTMESGDLSLEDSLAFFSKGVELTKSCQSALNDASQKISKLTEQDGFVNEVPLDDS
ncbi:exodeoxyribonuclease VII small subunit [Candidatus Thioglobus sp.]|nr:exodeoxyribonuclease VII small subunit [Candidatus Thioglobus sp.]MDB3870214.1 exodeoxyribonuclease VII small subunit [Candidatus Thioglobus sp.]MDB3892895.1 exodeoxyribonuclease VII small subunit [Candidatus Thioglobus sp.]MDC0888672.1 exodeoxyribonuclease VII small subunit [Candidatus Thioglobus sp.]MDC0904470.1 exodeoxyribonuclease VII small subunit [Candidatus Thioglobus sp.]